MPPGSTSTFEASRDDIVAMALENVGAIGPGETRNTNNSVLFDSGVRALNAMVKSWDKTGQRLWRFVRRTTTTVDGTASLSLSSTDVLDVDEPMSYLKSTGTSRTNLTAMSRDDYMRVSDRTTEGTPRQYYMEKTLTAITIYWVPVPDTSGDTIEYVAQLRGLDFTSGSDTPDFPSKWTNCLVYGLTLELCAKFKQQNLASMYKPLFDQEYAQCIQDDTERGSITLNYFANYRCGAG